jgi:hypothetical protein
MFLAGNVQQVLPVKILGRPLFLAQLVVIVFGCVASCISPLAWVFLRATSPSDVGPVNILVSYLSILDRCLSHVLTVILMNVFR